MAIKTGNELVRRAHAALRDAGPRGRELAEVLDQRGTRVCVANAIVGGFTLNFLNTILLQPLRADATESEFKQWVALLAHEASHIEQRHWVDSIAQEMRAYAAQRQVAKELNVSSEPLSPDLDPDAPEDQQRARAELLTRFAGQPAAVVYAALPLAQPKRLRAVLPGFREIAAAARAGLQRTRT